MTQSGLLHGSQRVDRSAMPIQRVLPGESYCELVRAVLESGGSVWLSSSGCSMLPTIRNGDEVLVRPAGAGDVLPGLIALRAVPSGFVLHRVMKVSAASLVTRGDNAVGDDSAALMGEVVGIATALRRDGRVRALEFTARHGFVAMLLHFENTFRRLVHMVLRRRGVSAVRAPSA